MTSNEYMETALMEQRECRRVQRALQSRVVA
jgi:hypothetical protein